jgi:LPXTG-motif cell wall-anchored protein
MNRALYLAMSLATAVMMALLLASIAYDDLDMPPQAVRLNALSVAGLLMVSIAGAFLLKRRK